MPAVRTTSRRTTRRDVRHGMLTRRDPPLTQCERRCADVSRLKHPANRSSQTPTPSACVRVVCVLARWLCMPWLPARHDGVSAL